MDLINEDGTINLFKLKTQCLEAAIDQAKEGEPGIETVNRAKAFEVYLNEGLDLEKEDDTPIQ